MNDGGTIYRSVRSIKHYSRRRLRSRLVIILASAYLAFSLATVAAQEVDGTADAATAEPPTPDLPFHSEQLDWRSTDQGDVTVFWAGGDNAPGEAALGIASETLRELDLIFPVSGGNQTSVYVFPSTADLREALQSTGLEWSSDLGALQSSDIWVTAINPRTAQQELTRSLPRQMLSRRLAALESRNRDALPDWLLSGLPGLFEEAGSSSYDGLVREALESQNYIPLKKLCDSFPTEEVTRSLAEAESVSLLSHVRAQYGAGAIGRVVSAYIAGENCTAGISRALGLSAQQLEEEWLVARFGHVSLGVFWRGNAAWLLLLLFGFLLSGLLLFPMRRQAEGD